MFRFLLSASRFSNYVQERGKEGGSFRTQGERWMVGGWGGGGVEKNRQTDRDSEANSFCISTYENPDVSKPTGTSTPSAHQPHPTNSSMSEVASTKDRAQLLSPL